MSKRPTADAAALLTGPAYAVAALFVVSPIVDVVASVWPLLPSNPQWRYGSVGIAANYLVSGVFGMMALSAIAALRGHGRLLRVLAIVNAVVAVLMVITALGFILDVLQVRASVPRDNARTLWMFDVGAMKAEFKYLFGAVVIGWLAFASRRAGRVLAPSGAEPAPPPLIHDRKS